MDHVQLEWVPIEPYRHPGAVDQLWDGTIDQPIIHVKAYEPTYERRNPNNRATPLSVDRP
jgi:hypothetical protein